MRLQSLANAGFCGLKTCFMKSLIKNKFVIVSGLVTFALIQILSFPYDYLIAGFWLGFLGGIVFKHYYKEIEL